MVRLNGGGAKTYECQPIETFAVFLCKRTEEWHSYEGEERTRRRADGVVGACPYTVPLWPPRCSYVGLVGGGGVY